MAIPLILRYSSTLIPKIVTRLVVGVKQISPVTGSKVMPGGVSAVKKFDALQGQEYVTPADALVPGA